MDYSQKTWCDFNSVMGGLPYTNEEILNYLKMEYQYESFLELKFKYIKWLRTDCCR